MLHNRSQREDLFGRIHPQTKNLARTLSTTTISPLCTLPHSSTHKETADRGSQEQTAASTARREHEPCSSAWTTLTVCAHRHHQFLQTPVRAHLGFLCNAIYLWFWAPKDKETNYRKSSLSLKLLPQWAIFNCLRSFTPQDKFTPPMFYYEEGFDFDKDPDNLKKIKSRDRQSGWKLPQP